ncbi:GMC oxidoreductase [Aplosporella prunicola CBS 121167]|uniref:GMC oxidoreductase n=1 Tax=Aplosporella prunicola CBS 121167 TaxID=1176127 RepID=A0A6A6BF97_9PEZI|nr:GMC oxidoreductase [Aplosporella prunicola CBS 121167]KAF2142053.1 GMC oxidoreductase [Aplosporella prunicola CBS 121167]
MKLTWVLSAVAAAMVSVVHAGSAAELLGIVASMPTCGVMCLEKSIAASPCGLTDTACTCSNATLNAQITLCVTETCTLKQQLTTKNATESLCDAPIRDNTKAVSYTGVIGGIIALVAYILRMVSRLPQFGGKVGWDDAVMTFAVLLVIPLTCLSVVLADVGLGRDIWTLPFKNITQVLYIYYFDEDLYLTALPMIKISILCFYLRIFPERNFRRIVYGVIGCCVGYGIAFLLVSVFQCRPISYAWTQWDGEHQGSCNNINAQGWTSAAINVVLDLVVIILPLPLLAKLQLNKRKKALLMLMFCVGFFVTVVSILRLQVLIKFGGTSNLTWDYVSVGYWSTVEVHVGIICACMPAMRSLFTHFMPKAMGQTTQGKYYNDHIRRSVDPDVEYDYVVVGSGPGGGPLASRLALAGNKVLLIDAGDDQGNATRQYVPALQLQSTEYEPMRWDYYVQHYADTTRQKRDSKMLYNTTSGELYKGKYPPEGAEPVGILYPRAGTLGGCASHNAMVTILPHDSDWTYIQSITGDDSWEPAKMKKYFEKLERNRYLPNTIVGHGFSGWLGTALTDLSLVIEDQKLLSLILSAATAMGKNIVAKLLTTVGGLAQVLAQDLNSGLPGRDQQTGLFQVPIAVDEGSSHRMGPRDFIMEVHNAKNSDGSRKYHLDIALNTLATKVVFDQSGDTPKAVGIEYLEGQSLYAADPRYAGAQGTSGSVNATKEVIVSAGAFNTPQLLKLSGVGPKEELKNFGINVVKDLPGVGTNMQDRYETTVIGKTPTDFTITHKCTFMMTMPDPCLEQFEEGLTPALRGTYATNGIAIAIVKKSSAAAEGDDPDILITGAPTNFQGYYPNYGDIGLSDAQHWSWITLKAHTRNNAGTVKLRSADPRDTPAITFNYFDTGNTEDGGDDKDLQAVYESMEFSRKMFDNLVPLDGSFSESWPGTNISSEAQLKQFIKDEAWGHHASCTCPIGADDDEMAVLDSNFRVRGVDGLRVVDASVFPKIPGFYIAAPIYMISEKAADAIINGAS